jgi:hypothetical protein
MVFLASSKPKVETFMCWPQNTIHLKKRFTSPHLKPEVRVAGWFLFRPKFPTWVNFGGP